MKIVYVTIILLLIILLWKNPFSPTNIISDLEPSPDSIHYLNPLISLMHGKGLVISNEYGTISTTAPPLYTFTLVPFFLIFKDIRSFYFTNVLLALTSVILFYKIISDLINNKIIKVILFLTFVTNFVVYLYPSFPMAENLLLPLYLSSVWLLIRPFSLLSICSTAFLAVAFFATKYVAWVLSISLILFSTVKVWSLKISLKRKYLSSLLFSLILGLLFLPFAYFQHFPTFSSSGYFSKQFFIDNLSRYLSGIIGNPVTVAGKDFIILPAIIGIISIFAIFVNLLFKKNRLLNFYFFISFFGTLYFISFFRIVDARYLLVFIPIFILICGLSLDSLSSLLIKLKRKLYVYLLLGFICLVLLSNIFSATLKQLETNFFKTQLPMNYLAIRKMNSYTDNLQTNSKPVIITTLSPYMVDFYSNHKYDLLPLSKNQYFTSEVDKVWGLDPQSNLLDIYINYLENNKEVLLSSYRTDNKYWFYIDMQAIKQKFDLVLADKGCNNQCNLYKLVLKK